MKGNHSSDGGVEDGDREKNMGERRVTLWARTIKALSEYRKTCKASNYIFTRSHGNPYQHSTENSRKCQLCIQFGEKMKALELPYSFGAFRKTATTTALITGANETVIKMLLGDAPDEVWRSYGMTVPEIVATAVTAMEKHYFGGKK